MKKFYHLILLCIVFMLLSCRCEPEETFFHEITFINSSDQKLYARLDAMYPDTLSFRTAPNPSLWEEDIIWPKETNTTALYYEYNTLFRYGLPSGVLMIYVYDAHLLENHPWDSLKMGNPVLKRYDLTFQDLIDLDWTIVYP